MSLCSNFYRDRHSAEHIAQRPSFLILGVNDKELSFLFKVHKIIERVIRTPVLGLIGFVGAIWLSRLVLNLRIDDD